MRRNEPRRGERHSIKVEYIWLGLFFTLGGVQIVKSILPPKFRMPRSNTEFSLLPSTCCVQILMVYCSLSLLLSISLTLYLLSVMSRASTSCLQNWTHFFFFNISSSRRFFQNISSIILFFLILQYCKFCPNHRILKSLEWKYLAKKKKKNAGFFEGEVDSCVSLPKTPVSRCFYLVSNLSSRKKFISFHKTPLQFLQLLFCIFPIGRQEK